MPTFGGIGFGGGGGLRRATVTGVTGSPSTGSFSIGSITYDFWRFTGTGSMTVVEGYADILVVGGGGSGVANYGGGGAGGVRFGMFLIPSGTHTLTVGGPATASSFGTILQSGAGSNGGGTNGWLLDFGYGSNSGGGSGGAYGQNENGPLQVNGAGAGGSFWAGSSNQGLVLNYANGNVEYGQAIGAAANTGSGTQSGNGGSGIIIVRIPR